MKLFFLFCRIILETKGCGYIVNCHCSDYWWGYYFFSRNFYRFRTRQQKIKLKAIEKEVELEKLRLETYTIETEKMRLELEQSKVLLLEEKQNSNK